VKKSCTLFSKYFGNFSSKQNILVIFSVKTNAKNILAILVQKKIYWGFLVLKTRRKILLKKVKEKNFLLKK
jgi:hypothetical protein